MKIDFCIKEFPDDLSKSYALDSFTEGDLSVEIEGKTVFDEPGILIVEFYLALKKWLDNHEESVVTDFIYESMDFEESPILAFIYIPASGLYKFDSVWKVDEARVLFKEIEAAYEDFKERLIADVYERSSYKLE